MCIALLRLGATTAGSTQLGTLACGAGKFAAPA